MSPNKVKQLPSGALELTRPSRRSLPVVMRQPEVEEPFSGRRGRQVANEMREKYFLWWHKMVMEKLVIESSFVLTEYAQQVVDQAINQMLDRYYDTERRPEANEFLKGFTQDCIQQLVANVRAILENHARVIGEFI